MSGVDISTNKRSITFPRYAGSSDESKAPNMVAGKQTATEHSQYREKNVVPRQQRRHTVGAGARVVRILQTTWQQMLSTPNGR